MAPTLEGGLRIDADSLTDWMILELICADATSLPGPPLYDQLSSRMEQDDDWKEFVVPDIVNQFNDQITCVSRAISSAPRDEDHAGSIFIKEEDAIAWYGAVNQARLSLEKQHSLSKLEEIISEEDLENLNPNVRAAVIRNHFYNSIQSLLLDYVM